MEPNDNTLIDNALAQGILTPEQHRRMNALADGRPLPTPDERFRVVNGFSEVFISIGLMMLFGALAGLLAMLLSNRAAGLFATAGVAWFATYYFTGTRRSLLPSILCCLYAASYVGQAVFLMCMHGTEKLQLHRLRLEEYALWQLEVPLAAAFAVLAAAAWRFRIPFLMLPIGILFTIMVTLGVKFGGNPISYRIVLGFCGLSMLGTALWFDLKDPERLRRTSDFAFWCYIVGSPLTVHPLFLTFFFNAQWREMPTLIIVTMILLALLISFVALLINRRALILSTLIYITVSLGYLLSKLVVGNVSTAILLTTLIVGTYVVLLGTSWTRARRCIMSRMTPRSWFAKLPPF